jgi:hypothetical protein
MEFGPPRSWERISVFKAIPLPTNKRIPGFEAIRLPTASLSKLWGDCSENVGDWHLRTIRRVILAGRAGWVDPTFLKRNEYYEWNCASTQDRQRMRLEGQRHSYMVAKATIEENIPKTIFEYMMLREHDFIECVTPLRGLASFVMIIHDFMIAVVKVSPASAHVTILD